MEVLFCGLFKTGRISRFCLVISVIDSEFKSVTDSELNGSDIGGENELIGSGFCESNGWLNGSDIGGLTEVEQVFLMVTT